MLPAAYDAQELAPGLYDDFIKFIDRSDKTARTYTTNLRQFAAFLQYAEIAAPKRGDIILYRQYLEAEHDAIQITPEGWQFRTNTAGEPIRVKCKPATVKAYLQSVKQFFKWTAAAGIYPNIAENVHAPKIRHDIHTKEALQPADVLAVEKSIVHTAQTRQENAYKSKKDPAGRARRATEQSKRLYAMFLLAVTAGLRTIELQRANIKDLQIISGTPYIYIYGKGHAEADTKKAIARPVYEALQDYINSRHDRPTQNSPLFVATGNRSGGQRLAVTTISTLLKRALQEAGYNSEKITAHSLRHTTGTTVQQITGDLFLTQKYMRHADPKTTEIYLHMDTDKQEAITAEKLYRTYHEAPEGL